MPVACMVFILFLFLNLVDSNFLQVGDASNCFPRSSIIETLEFLSLRCRSWTQDD